MGALCRGDVWVEMEYERVISSRETEAGGWDLLLPSSIIIQTCLGLLSHLVGDGVT